MKLKLKIIAVAAAMASLAGSANADLTSGTTQNNGSFSLLAFNTATLDWYIRDLGFLINTFLPTGVTTSVTDANQGVNSGSTVSGDKTPAAGLTLAGAAAGVPGATIAANFSDAAFSTWFTGQGLNAAANVRWMVGAYDLQMNTLAPATNNSRRMIVSSSNNAETFLKSNVDTFTATGNYGGLSSFFNPGTLSKSGTLMNSNANNAFGSGADLTAVDGVASLFYVTRAPSGAAGDAATSNTRYGNSPTSFATVTLQADGDFIYTLAPAEVAAVPLPAAAWMLGAGLMAMGGAARRRRALAVA